MSQSESHGMLVAQLRSQLVLMMVNGFSHDDMAKILEATALETGDKLIQAKGLTPSTRVRQVMLGLTASRVRSIKGKPWATHYLEGRQGMAPLVQGLIKGQGYTEAELKSRIEQYFAPTYVATVKEVLLQCQIIMPVNYEQADYQVLTNQWKLSE